MDLKMVQFFLCQCCHLDLAIPTRGVLAARGMPADKSSPLCGYMEESILHCLFQCSKVVEVWRLCCPAVLNDVNDTFCWSFMSWWTNMESICV